MSLKDQILNKIKSINDPGLLRELYEWLRNAEKNKTDQINEPAETYRIGDTVKNQEKNVKSGHKLKSPIDYLDKIAEKGGVEGIENPVEWQKKERRDRTLTIS